MDCNTNNWSETCANENFSVANAEKQNGVTTSSHPICVTRAEAKWTFYNVTGAMHAVENYRVAKSMKWACVPSVLS